jgi:UMF1 family MFS transporter
VAWTGTVAERRERIGWYFYDFANSAFSTTVVTVFLGPYLTSIARAAADPDGFVHPFGIRVAAASFFPYMVSLSVFLQVLVLPVLGAIADYSRRKKQMLFLFAYIGALATLSLYGVRGTSYLPGGLLYVIANISFGAALVFYNAFLPELAPPGLRDSVSSKGWALGYLGGGVLLGLNLALVLRAPALGLATEHAVRISLASAGAWWAIFTLIPLATLRARRPARALPAGEHLALVGFRQVARTLARLPRYPHTMRFLGAYLLYNDGIQTVITLSSQFGQEELGLPMSTLAAAILMVQFVAFAGALGFGWVAQGIGAKPAVMISLVIWIAAIGYAYALLRTAADYFVLAAVIAIVLGGSQALSRSLFSLMIPRGQEAEYFSFYEVSERGTSWIGPLLFGLALQFTGSYRVAILSVTVFFVAGLLLLARVDIGRAVQEAGQTPGRAAEARPRGPDIR